MDMLESLYMLNCGFQNTIHLYSMESGAKIKDFLVELGSITGITGKRKHLEMFYGFTSFLTPHKIYRVDFTQLDLEPVVRILLYIIELNIFKFKKMKVKSIMNYLGIS